VFNANPALVARLAHHIERVLVVDPFPGSAKLQADMMRRLGSMDVEIVDRSKKAYEMAESFNPQIILTEYRGVNVDGPLFTKRLRRSPFHCRQAPVIVVTSEATELSIKNSRDSGAHEFLKKPFAAADLMKRVENVALKPRPWIEAVHYVGPCRRRFNNGAYHGPKKRKTDAGSAAEATYAGQVDQIMRIMKSGVLQWNDDPSQAARSLRSQVQALSALGMGAEDPRLTYVIRALLGQVEGAISRGAKPTMPAKSFFDDVAEAAELLDRSKAA
jgi:CheY-like chemotaxis protein